MTDREKIRTFAQKRLNENMYKAKTRGCLHTIAANEDKELIAFIDSIPKEPVSEDLLEIAIELEETIGTSPHSRLTIVEHLVKAANWQKKNLWKDAQGDDLPDYDVEVIALQGFKVVFAHRPNPNGWDGKSLSTGKVEHFEPKTYDKGGWNMEGVTYWLDVELPEGIE